MANLKKYQAKRNFTKTKEPIGKVTKSKTKLKYCIQHHLARKDHYDFRLEWNGVLLSWAVPKGPSTNPTEKRLAVHVENHPLSYRNFEGTIPQGEYGGGTVMLWDRGYYEPLTDFKAGYQKGTLKFFLHGSRLKGAFTLIHIAEDNWLLIKEKDAYVNSLKLTNFKTSIKTGRTMSEIATHQKSSFHTSKKDAIVCGIKITNPDKIIFSNPKVTKLDIAMYYHKIAPKMLPLIKNRLISTIRMPDGEGGTKFFKKHFADNPYLGQVKIPNSKGHKEDYYYIKDEKGLIYEVQMNSFEFHIWGSEVNHLNYPNLMVFDLDPDTVLSLAKTRLGVQDLKNILKEFNLNATLKTSGGKGYHILVPIKNKITWSKFTNISSNIAALMSARFPDKYTSNIRLKARENKIFIDWERNTKGATSVAPYSLRLKAKPSISAPIPWSKLATTKPDEILITKYL